MNADVFEVFDRDRELITPLLPNSIDADNDSETICEGYLTLDEPELWSAEHLDSLPDSWFKETKVDRTKRYTQGIDSRYQTLVICDRLSSLFILN